MSKKSKLFITIMSIGCLFVGSHYYLDQASPASPESRQQQFLNSCMDVFEQSEQECLVFMERWGQFMNR